LTFLTAWNTAETEQNQLIKVHTAQYYVIYSAVFNNSCTELCVFAIINLSWPRLFLFQRPFRTSPVPPTQFFGPIVNKLKRWLCYIKAMIFIDIAYDGCQLSVGHHNGSSWWVPDGQKFRHPLWQVMCREL